MKRLCPTCFTELSSEANYCPACEKCMRGIVEQTNQYIGCTPVTAVVATMIMFVVISIKILKMQEVITWLIQQA